MGQDTGVPAEAPAVDGRVRALLIGGGGFMGERAARALRDAGHDVAVLTRGGDAPDGVEALAGDRRDPAALARVFAGRRFDLTADFVAYDAADVEALVPHAGPLGRYAMISSGQVYLVTREPRPPFREQDADAPLMDEPATDTSDHAEWAYGMGKRRAEKALETLRARGVDALALRLPVVQGEDDPSRRLWAWIERLADGGPVPLPEGGERPLRFVRAVAVLATAPWPASPALNLAQPDVTTLRELIAALADALGVAPRLVPCSREAMAAAWLDPAALPYAGRWASVPDPARAAAELGFHGAAMSEWLPRVVAAHLERRPPSHAGYAQRAREREWLARLDPLPSPP
jgi:nucleoside-diphosphate-sugar epimerase